MKRLILFLICLVLGAAVSFAYTNLTKRHQDVPLAIPFLKTPSPTFSIANPPSESLQGKIASMSGEIEWTSRIATESTKLVATVPIIQGIDFTTKDDGNLAVEFDQIAKINIFPKTHISFIQTLPVNIVIAQSTGIAQYQKQGTIPMSIRALHLLIENNGEIEVSINETSPIITIKVKMGSIKAAFNNVNYVTQAVTAEADQTLIYNDLTRRSTVK